MADALEQSESPGKENNQQMLLHEMLPAALPQRLIVAGHLSETETLRTSSGSTFWQVSLPALLIDTANLLHSIHRRVLSHTVITVGLINIKAAVINVAPSSNNRTGENIFHDMYLFVHRVVLFHRTSKDDTHCRGLDIPDRLTALIIVERIHQTQFKTFTTELLKKSATACTHGLRGDLNCLFWLSISFTHSTCFV